MIEKEKFNRILDGLLEKSRSRELNWETTIRKGKYLASLGDSAISVSKNILSGFDFEFRNENGDVFEIYSIDRTDRTFDKAQEIYNLAHEKSCNVNEKIDQILKKLEDNTLAA